MRRLALFAATLALGPASRVVAPPPAEAAKTAEGALEELAPESFPAFADDLDFAGLDDALGRSATWLARLAAADPGRTFGFGRERVPIQRLQATLARFRELALARPSPEALGAALRSEFRVFRSIGDGRGTVLFTGYYLPELRGSPVRRGAYQVPLHRAPDDLVVVRAKDFPALSDDLVGRVQDGRLVPYPTRAEIAGGALLRGLGGGRVLRRDPGERHRPVRGRHLARRHLRRQERPPLRRRRRRARPPRGGREGGRLDAVDQGVARREPGGGARPARDEPVVRVLPLGGRADRRARRPGHAGPDHRGGRAGVPEGRARLRRDGAARRRGR